MVYHNNKFCPFLLALPQGEACPEPSRMSWGEGVPGLDLR